jgi:hypothetical protein
VYIKIFKGFLEVFMKGKRGNNVILVMFTVLFIASGVLIGCTTTDQRLVKAAHDGNLADVKKALDKSANINALSSLYDYSSYYYSALGSAAGRGHFSIVRYLIEQGANINIRDSDGFTPLIKAMIGRHFEIVRYLVERGADVNFGDKDGRTPLIYASSNGNLDMVKYFVENRANLNARDVYGRSALNHAYDKGNIEIYNFLLAQGAMVFESNPQQSAPVVTQSQASPSTPSTQSTTSSSTLQTGRYAASGTNTSIRISSIGSVDIFNGSTQVATGTYRISGNQIVISWGIGGPANLSGRTFTYTITSNTSFSGHGENWVRTGSF